MSTSQGTPKTLRQAIENGALDAFQKYAKDNPHGAMECHWNNETHKERVFLHVKDFISQKISVFAMSDNQATNDAMLKLFKKLIAE